MKIIRLLIFAFVPAMSFCLCLAQTNQTKALKTTAATQESWESMSNRWNSIPLGQIKKAGSEGDVSAQYFLAIAFATGLRVDQDQGEAYKWMKLAAQQGLARAQRKLGWMLQNGMGVEVDMPSAVEWYRKAAEAGDVQAQINLGWTYATGDLDKRDYEAAEKWMRQGAEQGSANAQYSLGYLLMSEFDKNGKWVPNFAIAAEWYRKAADQGYDKAQYELAEMYNCGQLGDDQRSNCIPWYLKAAAQGNVKAQAEVGELPRYYLNSELLKTVDTVQALRQSAESGDFEAQFQLAQKYQNGDGLPKDPVQAFQWMTKAAHNGAANSAVSTAMYYLGLMYEKGEGVSPDLSAARNLFIQAAEYNQQPEAAFRVGQMYEKGEGVAQDDRKAAEFYANEYHFYMAPNDPNYIHPEKYPNGVIQYAATTARGLECLLKLWSQGRGLPDDKDKKVPGYRDPGNLMKYWEGQIRTANAQFYAGELYYQGNLVPKDLSRAAEWFNKAAMQGSPEAMNQIGELWAVGMDGAPDPKEAVRWYRKAADKGLAVGELNLGRALQKGEGIEQNTVQAWAWLELAADQNLPAARQEAEQLAAKLSPEELAAAKAHATELAGHMAIETNN